MNEERFEAGRIVIIACVWFLAVSAIRYLFEAELWRDRAESAEREADTLRLALDRIRQPSTAPADQS